MRLSSSTRCKVGSNLHVVSLYTPIEILSFCAWEYCVTCLSVWYRQSVLPSRLRFIAWRRTSIVLALPITSALTVVWLPRQKCSPNKNTALLKRIALLCYPTLIRLLMYTGSTYVIGRQSYLTDKRMPPIRMGGIGQPVRFVVWILSWRSVTIAPGLRSTFLRIRVTYHLWRSLRLRTHLYVVRSLGLSPW